MVLSIRRENCRVQFKAAVYTSQSMPATSLIKRICSPEEFKFTMRAPGNLYNCNKSGPCIMGYLYRWGCSLKKTQLYRHILANIHLTIPTLQLKMQVSSNLRKDVSCDCCGKGTVEIKCQFCYKDSLPDDDRSNFCMAMDSSGKKVLS